MVAFADVSKSFGDRNILTDVSFSVAEGEALCIPCNVLTKPSLPQKLSKP